MVKQGFLQNCLNLEQSGKVQAMTLLVFDTTVEIVNSGLFQATPRVACPKHIPFSADAILHASRCMPRKIRVKLDIAMFSPSSHRGQR
jgi:hypothetical protein